MRFRGVLCLQTLAKSQIWVKGFAVQWCGCVHHQLEFKVTFKPIEDFIAEHVDREAGSLVQSLLQDFDRPVLVWGPRPTENALAKIAKARATRRLRPMRAISRTCL